MNPSFAFFWGCFLTIFMPNSFHSMDSASQSDFYIWFSCLHIGLYRYLRYQDIHTEPAEITCKRFAAFLTGSCSPARKLQSISNATRDLLLQSWIAPLLPWTDYKLWIPPTSVRPPDNEDPWFMKSSMLSEVLLQLVTDTGVHPAESQTFFILHFTGTLS